MNRQWMPFYVADYLAGTSHLTTLEHGAYILLIIHYWTKGTLPSDDEIIRRITRLTAHQWNQHKDVLRAQFLDGWRHARIDKELSKAIEKSKVNSANAKRRHGDGKAPDEPTHTQLQLPKERKKDITPGGVPSKYEFEDGIIRLNKRDFDAWSKAYSCLDLRAELMSLSQWAGTQGQNWFHALKGALAKRNREVKSRKENLAEAGGFKWNGMEGIL